MSKEIFSEEENIWRKFQGSPDDRRREARKHEIRMLFKEMKELEKIPQETTELEFIRKYNVHTGEKLEK